MKNVPVVPVIRRLGTFRLESEQQDMPAGTRKWLEESIDRLVFALEFYEEVHPLTDAARPEIRRKGKKRRTKRRRQSRS